LVLSVVMVFPVELLASVVIIFVVTRFGSLLDVVHRPFRNIKCGMVLSAAGQYHLVPFPTRPRSLLAHPFFEEFETLLMLLLCALPQFLFLEFLTCAPGATPFDLAFCTLLALLLFTVRGMLLAQVQGSHKYLILAGVGGSMLALVLMSCLPAGTLDFDLEGASADLSVQVSAFLAQSLHVQQPFVLGQASLYLGLAIFAGVLTSALGIPAFEFARCYNMLLTAQGAETTAWLRLLLHANFFLPLVAALGWVPPLATDLLCAGLGEPGSAGAAACHQRIVGGRLLVVGACALLRLWLMRSHVQAHYNSEVVTAHRSLEVALAAAPPPPPPAKGSTDEPPVPAAVAALAGSLRTRQRLLCWRSLQYVSPALLQISLLLMLKNRVRYDMGFCAMVPGADWMPQRLAASSARSAANLAKAGEAMGAGAKLKVLQAFKQHTFVTPTFYEPVLGFLLWWCCAAWFVLCALALLHWQSTPGTQAHLATEHAVESAPQDRTTKCKPKTK
jgi:hypothetical protein